MKIFILLEQNPAVQPELKQPEPAFKMPGAVFKNNVHQTL